MGYLDSVKTLFAIAALLGMPLHLDSATAALKRPSRTRVQIELDLLKEKPPKIWIAPHEGDSQALAMLDPGPSVIKNACGIIKYVVILISGRPMVIEPYLSSIDALVAAWLPGTEGLGVTGVLFGD